MPELKLRVNRDAGTPFKWSRVVQHTLLVKTGTRGLSIGLIVDIGEITVLAVEAAAIDGDLQAALDDHGHTVIGTFRKLPRAKAAAERYARKWIRGQVAAASCGCAEIPPPALSAPARINAKIN
jgi:hypothetical protein